MDDGLLASSSSDAAPMRRRRPNIEQEPDKDLVSVGPLHLLVKAKPAAITAAVASINTLE